MEKFCEYACVLCVYLINQKRKQVSTINASPCSTVSIQLAGSHDGHEYLVFDPVQPKPNETLLIVVVEGMVWYGMIRSQQRLNIYFRCKRSWQCRTVPNAAVYVGCSFSRGTHCIYLSVACNGKGLLVLVCMYDESKEELQCPTFFSPPLTCGIARRVFVRAPGIGSNPVSNVVQPKPNETLQKLSCC